MGTRLWLVEGIPGSGKSAAAERLCELATSQGVTARWWLEEDKNHPVLPATLRRRSAEAQFPDLCVAAFASFLREEEGVLILEGSAFQSTVRFMFANGMGVPRMQAYLDRWAEVVAPADPRLLVLRADDPGAHYAEFVAERRGSAWMEKVSAYVEQTPIAQANGWTGLAGFISFWERYQEVCATVCTELPWPVMVMPSWSQSREFDEGAALSFFTRPSQR